MEKRISTSQLAKQLERIADDIETARTVYRVERRGHRPMLLMDHEYFESHLATLEFIQRHPNWKQELAESRRMYAAGEYIPFERVLEERGLADAAPKTKRKRAVPRASRDRRTRSR